jgi:hypothetical protein
MSRTGALFLGGAMSALGALVGGFVGEAVGAAVGEGRSPTKQRIAEEVGGFVGILVGAAVAGGVTAAAVDSPPALGAGQ